MVLINKLSEAPPQGGAANFAERMKRALGARSKAWLAKKVGLSPTAIAKYLNGTQPTIGPAIAIANALDVRLSWLLAGEGEMKGPEEPPRQKAAGANLFDASEAEWVFLPHYRFDSAFDSFTPIVLETFPIRRDWLKRSLGTDKGLWVTEMPTDELPSVAQKGETIVCRNVFSMDPGKAYLFGLDGRLIVRRFTMNGFVTDARGTSGFEENQPATADLIPIGVILGRIALSPIATKY